MNLLPLHHLDNGWLLPEKKGDGSKEVVRSGQYFSLKLFLTLTPTLNIFPTLPLTLNLSPILSLTLNLTPILSLTLNLTPFTPDFPLPTVHSPLPTVHFPLPTAREKPTIIEFSRNMYPIKSFFKFHH